MCSLHFFVWSAQEAGKLEVYFSIPVDQNAEHRLKRIHPFSSAAMLHWLQSVLTMSLELSAHTLVTGVVRGGMFLSLEIP